MLFSKTHILLLKKFHFRAQKYDFATRGFRKTFIGLSSEAVKNLIICGTDKRKVTQ